MGSLNLENDPKQELNDSGYVQEADGTAKEAPAAEASPSEDKESPNLLDLSDDVLLCILQYCSPMDLKALGYTCSRLGTLILDRTLWQRVDARGVPTGRNRMRWLLTHALSVHTTSLKLSGYAREAKGCLGYMSGSRDELPLQTPLLCPTPEEMHPWNLWNREAMENELTGPRLLRLCAQALPRYGGGFPYWPEGLRGAGAGAPPRDGDPADHAGHACPGPQVTLTHAALARLTSLCTNLTELALEHVVLDCNMTKIGMFPQSLRTLSLLGTKCFNLEKSFLYKIQDHLINLEDLDVSECEWVEPACMLPLSKLPRLARLAMRLCAKLTEFVAYASLATRYGFKQLRVLDLRGSPVGDSEVSALGWVPGLEQLYLSPAPPGPRPPAHAHFTRAAPAPPARVRWEEQEPPYYSCKYPGSPWAEEEARRAPAARPDHCTLGSCVLLHHVGGPGTDDPLRPTSSGASDSAAEWSRTTLQRMGYVVPRNGMQRIMNMYPEEGLNQDEGDQVEGEQLEGEQAEGEQVEGEQREGEQRQRGYNQGDQKRGEVKEDGKEKQEEDSTKKQDEKEDSRKRKQEEDACSQSDASSSMKDKRIRFNEASSSNESDNEACSNIQVSSNSKDGSFEIKEFSCTSKNVPSSSINEPTSSLNEPTSSMNEPTSSMNEPNSSMNEPSSSTSQPSSSINKPTSSRSEPNSSNEPTSSTHEPFYISEPNYAIDHPNFTMNDPNFTIKEPTLSDLINSMYTISRDVPTKGSRKHFDRTQPKITVSNLRDALRDALDNTEDKAEVVRDRKSEKPDSDNDGPSSDSDDDDHPQAKRCRLNAGVSTTSNTAVNEGASTSDAVEDSSKKLSKSSPKTAKSEKSSLKHKEADMALNEEPNSSSSNIDQNQGTSALNREPDQEPSNSTSNEPNSSTSNRNQQPNDPSTSQENQQRPQRFVRFRLNQPPVFIDDLDNEPDMREGYRNPPILIGGSNPPIVIGCKDEPPMPIVISRGNSRPILIQGRNQSLVLENRNQPAANDGCGNRDDNHNVHNNNDVQQPDWNNRLNVDGEGNRPPPPAGPADGPDPADLTRHRILYVNVGRRRHAMYQITMPEPVDLRTQRPLTAAMNLIYSSHIAPRLEYTSLVTDAAIRRFGRADGENINYVQIGPMGPVPAPYDDPHARPNRSNLRVLSVTGYRHITNYSLTHLATAAPHLQSIDFTGTRVTESGVEHFRNFRPDCRVRYGPVETPKEDSGRPHSR